MAKPQDKIPKGIYCYSKNGVCPYWRLVSRKDRIGYCGYLKMDDRQIEKENGGISLLWNQCKSCDINIEDDNE